MAVTHVPDDSRTAACNAIVDLLDAGSGAGYVELRTGTPPADADDAATGTLLATITLNDPAFGSAANGVATADVTPEPEDVGLAVGRVGWFRAYDSDDNPVLDGDATGIGGGGAMTLDTTQVVTGGAVKITAWTVTVNP